MHLKYCRILLLALSLVPSWLFSQPTYTASIDKPNPNRMHTYVDDDGYFAAVLQYPTAFCSIHFFKDGPEEIARWEGDLSFFTFEGYGSDDEYFCLYGIGEGKKRQAIMLDKRSRKIEIKEINIPDIRSVGKDLLTFSHDGHFYKMFHHSGKNVLGLYKFTRDSAQRLTYYDFSATKGDLRDAYKEVVSTPFTYVPPDGNMRWSVFWGEMLYVRGDSVIFSIRTGNDLKGHDRQLVILDTKWNRVATRVIDDRAKYGYSNEFLLGNTLFFVRSYQDSLVLEFKNFETLESIRRMTFNDENFGQVKRSLYLSSKGDTLETKWKNVNHRILDHVHTTSKVMSISKISSGYEMTLGLQTFASSGGGGMMMNSSGGFTTIPSGQILPSEQYYFRMCLSDEFEIMPCESYLRPIDKAFARKKELIQESMFRYKDFDIGNFSKVAYLVYVDKDKKTLNIQLF